MSNYRNLLAGFMLSLPLCLPVKAEPVNGWYAALEGGAVWVNAWDHIRTQTEYCYTSVKPGTAGFSTGWAGLGMIGFGMHQWRVEVEGGYRKNDLDSYNKNGWTLNHISGDLAEITAMLNLIYDVALTDRFSLSVGVGAGGDHASIKLDLPGPDIRHDEWNFAYQGLAGVNYALAPNLAMFANYRYLDSQNDPFQAAPNLKVDGQDFQKHTTSLGLRFAFATPLAPVPVAPETPPQPVAPVEREFLIFFGFNKSALTPQAMETVRQAAVAATQPGTANVRVVGHTDRSGSLSYNRALSLRRAMVVKKALVSEGVLGSAISIAGKGESSPIVQTADGVREAQNRRVQINF